MPSMSLKKEASTFGSKDDKPSGGLFNTAKKPEGGLFTIKEASGEEIESKECKEPPKQNPFDKKPSLFNTPADQDPTEKKPVLFGQQVDKKPSLFDQTPGNKINLFGSTDESKKSPFDQPTGIKLGIESHKEIAKPTENLLEVKVSTSPFAPTVSEKPSITAVASVFEHDITSNPLLQK